jgi:hypothetical protein
MTSPVKTLMEAAGLPADNLLTQRDSLPESLQMLHRQTLLALGQSGNPPTRHQLEVSSGEHVPSLKRALTLLDSRTEPGCRTGR